jgi:hypothetical protein
MGKWHLFLSSVLFCQLLPPRSRQNVREHGFPLFKRSTQSQGRRKKMRCKPRLHQSDFWRGSGHICYNTWY